MTEIEREFVGLFLGEGAIIFMGRQSSKKAKRRGFRVSFCIKMRDDDSPMLEFLQREFGGKIYHQKGNLRYISKGTPITNPLIENPSCEWVIFRKEECLRILNLLEKVMLPSKKKKELVPTRKLINMEPGIKGKTKFGNRWTDEQILEQDNLHQEIISIRKFVPYKSS